MNTSVKSNYVDGKWRNAMVILANWKDFVPGMTYSYRKVQSRFFIWCRYGSGTVVVNRKTYRIRQGDYLFLPWNHSITYQPESDDPFSVGCIHVIPDMPEEEEPYFQPFHWERPELPEYNARKDEKLSGFEGVYAGHAAQESSLFQLGRYIIDSYNASCPEGVLRTFPRLLLYELEREIDLQREEIKGDLPPQMLKILRRMDCLRLEENKSVEVIRMACGVSRSTLYRIFRKYLDMTPEQYLLNRKMEFCAYLLRHTRLTNRAIAARIGVDVSYFARVFRKKFELTPGQFRKAPNVRLENLELFRYDVKRIRQKVRPVMKGW